MESLDFLSELVSTATTEPATQATPPPEAPIVTAPAIAIDHLDTKHGTGAVVVPPSADALAPPLPTLPAPRRHHALIPSFHSLPPSFVTTTTATKKRSSEHASTTVATARDDSSLNKKRRLGAIAPPATTTTTPGARTATKTDSAVVFALEAMCRRLPPRVRENPTLPDEMCRHGDSFSWEHGFLCLRPDMVSSILRSAMCIGNDPRVRCLTVPFTNLSEYKLFDGLNSVVVPSEDLNATLADAGVQSLLVCAYLCKESRAFPYGFLDVKKARWLPTTVKLSGGQATRTIAQLKQLQKEAKTPLPPPPRTLPSTTKSLSSAVDYERRLSALFRSLFVTTHSTFGGVIYRDFCSRRPFLVNSADFNRVAVEDSDG